MGRLDRDAPQASGEDQPAAVAQGTLARSNPDANPGAFAAGSWRPWLVTVVVVVGAMVLISGISHLTAKTSSPNIALSDR